MLRSIFVRGLWGLAFAVASAASSAEEYGGRLDDPGNAALVGSDLGAALFGDEYEVALNVALYHLAVGDSGTLTFTSTGFGAGGVDPYFTLFAGSGTGATFVGSNYDQAFTTGGDFTYSFAVAAGAYQFALGAFANMSFAENLGTGTLADGFIGLGVPESLGSTGYALDVSFAPGTVTAVPEPATYALLLAGLGALALSSRRFAPRRR